MPETHELLTRARIATIYDDARPNFPGVDFHPFSKLNEPNAAFMDSFARAAYAKGVTAARESDAAARIAAQREAASRAWDAGASHARSMASFFTSSVARSEYLDREHPLPARECVLCDVCGEDVPQPEPDVRVTRHNIADCVRNVRKSFAAGVGR